MTYFHRLVHPLTTLHSSGKFSCLRQLDCSRHHKSRQLFSLDDDHLLQPLRFLVQAIWDISCLYWKEFDTLTIHYVICKCVHIQLINVQLLYMYSALSISHIIMYIRESIIILTVITVSGSSILAVAVTTSVIVAWIWATIIRGQGITQQYCKYNQKLHVRADKLINAYAHWSFDGSLYTCLVWIVHVWPELMVYSHICLPPVETHGLWSSWLLQSKHK